MCVRGGGEGGEEGRAGGGEGGRKGSFLAIFFNINE